MDDEKDRDTIHTLIPKAKDLRLLPVGRLDRDTTGVIILTNENGWIHPLTHPSFVHKRRYEVVVQGIPTEDAINALQKGPILPGDEISIQPCIIRLVEVDTNAGLSLIDMSIEENFPMQVQRMVEFLKCEMINLKRIEFGPIKLKGLRRGEWRELTQVEIERLKGSCVKSGSVPPKRKLRSRLFRTKKPGSGYSNRTSGDDKAEPKSYQTDPRRRRSAEPTARGDQGERKSPQQSWVSKTKQAGTVKAQELRPRNPTKRTGGEQVSAKSYQVDPRKRRDGASEGKGSRDERNGAWPQQGEERKSTGRR
jgi:pseudouridine synthase